MNETWQRWEGWCDRIESDLRGIVDDARVFDGVVKLYRGNQEWIEQHEGNHFFAFVQRCYGARAMLAIRRHVKVDDAISLARLIADIEKVANQLTFDEYMRRFPDTGAPWQAQMYRRFSEDGSQLSAKIVREDKATLQEVGSRAKTIVDKTIAHLDRNVPHVEFTLEELAAALDTFNTLTCKYLGLVTGHGHASLESTLLFPWERIFDVPMNKAKVNL